MGFFIGIHGNYNLSVFLFFLVEFAFVLQLLISRGSEINRNRIFIYLLILIVLEQWSNKSLNGVINK